MNRFVQKQHFATFSKIAFIRVLASICLSGCLAKTRVSQNTHTLLYLSVCCVAKILESRLFCKTTHSANLSCKNNPCIKQTGGAQALFFPRKKSPSSQMFWCVFFDSEKIDVSQKAFFLKCHKSGKRLFLQETIQLWKIESKAPILFVIFST